MDVFEALEQRRGIKFFDPAVTVSAADEARLCAALRLTPTAFNMQNWRFVMVRDPALRQKIRAAAWDQSQMTDAALLVVLCADLKAWEKQPERYWAHAPEPPRSSLVATMQEFYRGNDQLQRDEAMRSCGLAAMGLMLAAQSLGYDSCPMDGFDFARVSRIVRLPKDHVISLIVAIGGRAQEVWPRGGQLPDEEIFFTDHFPQS